MKYFVFGDVHGDYDALMEALNQSGYNPSNKNHQIISLGDNFGRAQTGKKSKGVWKYLISNIHKNKPVCIRGNHELILLDVLQKGYLSYVDICNGEHKTISSLAHCSESQARFDPEAIELARETGIEDWIKSLPWFYETENYIFVHGWVPTTYPETALTDAYLSDWERAVWARSFDNYCSALASHWKPEKIMVAGHWTTANFWNLLDVQSHDIFYDKENKMCFLDGCTVITHKVNIFVVED